MVISWGVVVMVVMYPEQLVLVVMVDQLLV
jgi:hypothetical protein